MAYSPNPDDAEFVFRVLLACSDPQHGQHKAALVELSKCRSTPEFAPCVAAVFAGVHGAASAAECIRELAGIELKNAMKVISCTDSS